MSDDESTLVYSSEKGRIKPEPSSRSGSRPRSDSRPAGPAPVRNDGFVRVRRETKGRKGKGVVVVTGLNLGEQALKDLARELKQLCGSGGTVKDGIIEVQGDQTAAIMKALTDKGFKVKQG